MGRTSSSSRVEKAESPSRVAGLRQQHLLGLLKWTGPPHVERWVLTFISTCSHRPSRFPKGIAAGDAAFRTRLPVARPVARYVTFTLTRFPVPLVLVPCETALAEASWGGPRSVGSTPLLRCPRTTRKSPVDPIASPFDLVAQSVRQTAVFDARPGGRSSTRFDLTPDTVARAASRLVDSGRPRADPPESGFTRRCREFAEVAVNSVLF